VSLPLCSSPRGDRWAGIGGLAAALALRDCDVDTVVLEQADHVGVGIQLTPNAIQVRARLGQLPSGISLPMTQIRRGS
jgi:salicylate hydroxylase